MPAIIITPEDLQEFKDQLIKEITALLSQRHAPMTRKWLKTPEVRRILGMSPGTLQNLRINGEWNEIREAMGVSEDYFAYYRSEYQQDIIETLEDMLTEAAPNSFKSPVVGTVDYPGIFTEAWDKFLEQPERYREWELAKLTELKN